MLPEFTITEIAGLVVASAMIIVVYLTDRSERRRRLRHKELQDTNWRTLETALGELARLLTGEHGLDEDSWEESIHEKLGDAKLAIRVLKPKNGVVRKRSRSKTRAKKSSAEKQPDTE
jgi:hypothetical protein